MTDATRFPAEGGCDCRAVRYRLGVAPLFVHCCHCRWCQREIGLGVRAQRDDRGGPRHAAGGEPELVDTPSASGAGQQIARCPRCRVAVWSHYVGRRPGAEVRSRRHARRPRPAAARHPHLHGVEAALGRAAAGVPAVPEYYDRKQHWPAASLARWQAVLPLVEAYRTSATSGTA